MMLVKSKQTKEEYYLTIEEWEQMKDKDPSSDRRYDILDSGDLHLKEQKIPLTPQSISKQKVVAIDPVIKTIYEAITEANFNSMDYSITVIEIYMEGRDWKDFETEFANDTRKGIIKYYDNE